MKDQTHGVEKKKARGVEAPRRQANTESTTSHPWLEGRKEEAVLGEGVSGPQRVGPAGVGIAEETQGLLEVQNPWHREAKTYIGFSIPPALQAPTPPTGWTSLGTQGWESGKGRRNTYKSKWAVTPLSPHEATELGKTV